MSSSKSRWFRSRGFVSRLGRLILERLEDRTVPSASFVSDPGNAGKYIVQMAEDVGGTNDGLFLRVSGGQLQYKLNGASFTSDLNSSAAGVQSVTFSSVSRIDVALWAGNDSLTLDMSGGSVIPTISGINFNGGTGTDLIVAALDANFTLTNSKLSISPGGEVYLTSIEKANLAGGNSPNIMDASAFDGSVTMDGGNQDDVLTGGSGNDMLTGTQGNDLIDGRGGNDILYSGNSGSMVLGGDGDDLLVGGNGVDALYGQGGHDQIYGSNGQDLLDGGDGNDTLSGESANDTLRGGLGYDTVKEIADTDFALTNSTLTGLGTDSLNSIENAVLTGGVGSRTIDCSAFPGDSTLDGGGGVDTLIGSQGINNFVNNQGGSTTIVGGGSANNISLTPSGFVSLVDSGGLDTLNFSTTTTGITLDLTNNSGTGQNVDGVGFTVALNGTFENVTGSSFSDSIIGNTANNIIYGGPGTDNIDGGAGNDIIFGGTTASGTDTDVSNDVIYGGPGTDQIDGGGGNDIIFGGTRGGELDDDTVLDNNNDIIYGGPGTDQIDGGAGNDIIFGGTRGGELDDDTVADNNNDIIYGGPGTDQIDGGAGNDIIFGGTRGGESDDDSDVGHNNDIIYGGPGTDQLDGGAGNDIIYGGTRGGESDGDTVVDNNNDIIYGGPGTDQIDGGAGNDIIYGGTGGIFSNTTDSDASNDIIYGGPGMDQIDAGDGNDIIFGGTRGGESDGDTAVDNNNDIIYGGVGGDQIDGGAGNDIIYGGTRGGESDGDAGADNNNDIIYGGPGIDQLDGGAGNDIIFGGTRSGETDGDNVAGDNNDILFGGPGNDALAGGSGDDSLTGGTGNDTFVYAGGLLGSDTVNEDPDVGTDTLDFSAFSGAVSVDLALTTLQLVNANNFSITFSSDTAIENVVGGKYADTIFGNSRDNRFLGADQLDDRFADAPIWNGVTQVVYLDFDSNHSLLVAQDHVYTQDERDAIEDRLQADYANFHFQFTQTLPTSGDFATLFFNKSPIVNGKAQAGGIADDLDFRNVNLGGTAAIDVNPLLGGPNQPVATSANFVAFSATVAAHELGHLVGLRHLDSAGPIGYGFPSALPSTSILPSYHGPTNAFETNSHMMASPASVGSSLFDAVGDPFFGEREAAKLAFNETGTVVNEQGGAHDSRATAQPLTLTSLAVPNTLTNGLNYGKDFGFAATAVVGSINLAGGVSEDDYYRFTGRAGDLLNIQVISNALTRITNPIDSILRVYDSAGNLVTYYNSTSVNDDELEGQDSILLDLLLPADGTFYIQVDTFTNVDVPDTDTGDYELFVYRFDAGNATDGGDYLDGRGGNDHLIGGIGNDMMVGGTGVNTLDGGDGTDIVIESGDVNFALADTSLQGPGSTTLASIEHAQLTGGIGDNSFQINGWTGTAIIDGGLGTDALVGGNTVNSWNLTGAGTGNVNVSVTFASMEFLTGGTASDTLNYAAYVGPVAVSLANNALTGFTSFSGMENMIGSAGADTVTAANTANTWNLTGVGTGNVGGFNFTAVENLVGGSVGDILNFAAYAGSIAVNLATGAATGFNSFANMEGLTGGTAIDTLTGLNTANTWNITSSNSGTVGGFAFSGVENLTGGSLDDSYILANGAGVTGIINGSGGVNSLDYSAFATGVTVNLTLSSATLTGGVSGIQHVFGGAGNDSLTGDTSANIFVGNAGNDALIGNEGRDILIGGNGADYLDGGTGDDILIGGRTSYDANRTALLSVLAEWTRTDLNYSGRLNHITGAVTGGLNGAFKLNATTLFDDNKTADTLWGRGDIDWFITGSKDNLMDRVSGETNSKI